MIRYELKNYVDYVWTVVDPAKTVLATCGLGNPILVEDVSHKPIFSQVGKGGKGRQQKFESTFYGVKSIYCFFTSKKNLWWNDKGSDEFPA